MEASNNKAMREALTEIRDLCLRVGKDISPLTKRYKSRECQAVNQCFRIAVDALAEPPRNCDRFSNLITSNMDALRGNKGETK